MKKIKSPTIELPITAFKVKYDSYVQETSEVDPDDEYSVASTSTDHTIHSISVCSDASMDCTGAFTLNTALNDTVYLVYAIHSTGDSFASYSGYGIEFIEVFQTEEKAERCAKQIAANAKLYNLVSQSYSKPTEKQLKDLLEIIPNGADFNPKKQIHSDKLYHTFYQDERDQVKSFHTPWNGYFENLDSCEVSVLRVQPESKPKRNYML